MNRFLTAIMLLLTAVAFCDERETIRDASGRVVSAEQIISSIKKGCKKNRYNIILMHDSEAKVTTAEALPKVIEWAQKEGYTFAAMEKGGPTVHHSVNN